MKKIAMFIAIAFMGTSLAALSLKEKQALAGLDFSWSEKRIKDNYGSDVKVSVDQDSFAGDMNAIDYASSRGAERVANAIAKICNDNIGKEALQAKKITKVVLKNMKTGRKVEIVNGTLTLLSAFGGSGDNDYFGENELKDAIENLL